MQYRQCRTKYPCNFNPQCYWPTPHHNDQPQPLLPPHLANEVRTQHTQCVSLSPSKMLANNRAQSKEAKNGMQQHIGVGFKDSKCMPSHRPTAALCKDDHEGAMHSSAKRADGPVQLTAPKQVKTSCCVMPQSCRCLQTSFAALFVPL